MLLRVLALAVVAAAALSPVPAQAESGPVAFTTSGPVVGLREGAVDAFRGIPYAAPPVGQLRWRAPRPARPWLAPRDATAYASPCAQRAGAEQLAGSSEDCLYLNVTTPRSPGGRKPVMVWIHGGGNFQGTARRTTHAASRNAATSSWSPSTTGWARSACCRIRS